MAVRKSDHLIVPLKPGNSGGGKGVEPSCVEGVLPSVHRHGPTAPVLFQRITQRVRAHSGWVLSGLAHHLGEVMPVECFRRFARCRDGGEPDALTTHVRF